MADEGAIPWQQTMLQRWHRDVKPAVDPELFKYAPPLLAAQWIMENLPDMRPDLHPSETFRKVFASPPPPAPGETPGMGWWDTAVSLVNPWDR
jgi:hypothetical protein